MFGKVKSRAKAKAEQEQAERARLEAMSEKELLAELILEVRSLNNTVAVEAENIMSTIKAGRSW